MAINQLPLMATVSGGDTVPIASSALGGDARVSVANLLAAVEVPTGILAISGYYVMRKVPALPPVNVNIGTSYANFTGYDTPPLIFPEGRASLAPMLTVGEFVAQRDMQGAMVWAALSGTWPATRDLTLAILVGADANPAESSFQFIAAGRGASLVSGSIAAPVANLNNPGGVIRAGEKIRLVAKMNVADVLALHRLSFIAQPLDGV